MPMMPRMPAGMPYPSMPATSTAAPTPPVQPQPMFPAYQDNSAETSSSRNYKQEIPDYPSTSASAAAAAPSAGKSLGGARTRIVCPEEHISLEERMAQRLQSMSRAAMMYR